MPGARLAYRARVSTSPLARASAAQASKSADQAGRPAGAEPVLAAEERQAVGHEAGADDVHETILFFMDTLFFLINKEVP